MKKFYVIRVDLDDHSAEITDLIEAENKEQALAKYVENLDMGLTVEEFEQNDQYTVSFQEAFSLPTVG